MDNPYFVKKVQFYNIPLLLKVVTILSDCGKDMAKKYGLQHWNNSWLKNYIIMGLCLLKNSVFLVFDGNVALATFQTKKIGNRLKFQKLATDPKVSGKGIGSFCLRCIEKQASDCGCTAVYCEVYNKSKHAIEFYINRGYTGIGKIDTLKYTELQMEKKL